MFESKLRQKVHEIKTDARPRTE